MKSVRPYSLPDTRYPLLRAISAFALLLASPVAHATITVFAEGRVRLPVIVAADAAPEETAAAEELARVLGVMSGLDWPVRTESAEDRARHVRSEGDAGRGFYIGRTREAARRLKPLRPAADLLRPTAAEIGPDGFRITTRGRRVFLEGATPEATANAVSWLLQRQGGVRWYAPGPLGEVIPRRTEWTLPELRVVREPAYVSREITGSGGEPWRTWCRRNGLRGRIEYNHNLTTVFPPELGVSHPEWFPLVQGRRVIPTTKADFNWQPDLTQPGVVERSVQQAEAHFTRLPGRASFSLGMNDSVRFDQGAGTRAAVEPLRYFRGMPDYSPLVLGFMNRAAESLELGRQPAEEARQTAGGARQTALGRQPALGRQTAGEARQTALGRQTAEGARQPALGRQPAGGARQPALGRQTAGEARQTALGRQTAGEARQTALGRQPAGGARQTALARQPALGRQPAGGARQTALARQPALGRTNKYLGCLAYFWCENVPAFPVHEQVVPYVTTDRTQFYDAAYRAADYELMSRWSRSGVRAYGLWEYGYGSAYVVPRLPHAMLAEAVREGWWRGARGYIADTIPHAGFDSFKVWMLAQLLWEPERTTAELEADFFNGWYGPAAEPMRRFFARCEAQWMAQQGPPWWIKYYRQQDQPLLFPSEVCRELRGLLAAAEEAAKRSLECGGSTPPLTGRLDGPPSLRQGQSNLGHESRAAASSRGAESGVEPPHSTTVPETRNPHSLTPSLPHSLTPSFPHSLTPYSSRIALTSRAFAVTEAAVEFDRIRRALGAHDGSLAAPELVGQLRELQQARAELESAAAAAAYAADGRRTEDGQQSLASTDVEAGEAGCVPVLRSKGNAADGTQPAIAFADVAFLLRNDPVPRLLAALGRREAVAPLAVLAQLEASAEVPMDSAVIVPAHWRDLAAACADGRLTQLKSRLSNGDFSRVAGRAESAADRAVAGRRQEPRFLYPKWGELPADWEVRGIATEAGRVALVAREVDTHLSPLRSARAGEAGRGTRPDGMPCEALAKQGGQADHLSPLPAAKAGEAYRDPRVRDRAGEASRGPVGPRLGEAGRGTRPGGARALRIEGAWETMLSTILPATPGQLHVLEAQLRGHSSPGNDASLFLVFMTADGRTTGEYRTQTLPKGASAWRALLLAAAAPADAAWVSVGVAALRQPAGDWLEVAEVSLGVDEKGEVTSSK